MWCCSSFHCWWHNIFKETLREIFTCLLQNSCMVKHYKPLRPLCLSFSYYIYFNKIQWIHLSVTSKFLEIKTLHFKFFCFFSKLAPLMLKHYNIYQNTLYLKTYILFFFTLNYITVCWFFMNLVFSGDCALILVKFNSGNSWNSVWCIFKIVCF